MYVSGVGVPRCFRQTSDLSLPIAKRETPLRGGVGEFIMGREPNSRSKKKYWGKNLDSCYSKKSVVDPWKGDRRLLFLFRV